MQTQPAWEGFLRGLGIAVIIGGLSFIGNQTNLAWLNPTTATIVAGLAAWLEGIVQKYTGNAVFGALS